MLHYVAISGKFLHRNADALPDSRPVTNSVANRDLRKTDAALAARGTNAGRLGAVANGSEVIMATTSYYHGHLIEWRDGKWVYEDAGDDATEPRPCPRCGELPTPEGHDACLGEIPGALYACCGHGVEAGYIIVERREYDGTVVPLALRIAGLAAIAVGVGFWIGAYLYERAYLCIGG